MREMRVSERVCEKRFHFGRTSAGTARAEPIGGILPDWAYPIGLRNSTPIKWMSPAARWRRTLAWIGGIPDGTRAEAVREGAGIVKVSISLTFKDLGQVIKAPKALIFRVLASSMNWSEWESRPRINRGTCSRMRCERRRSSVMTVAMTSGPRSSLVLISTWVLVPLLEPQF
jgi:hypothetical protein